ncbi:MAG: endo,4-beta-xylanase [Flavisolibacter sp.]|nr:endo,4-beta-xylanase [Flavisolibacter sp.]
MRVIKTITFCTLVSISAITSCKKIDMGAKEQFAFDANASGGTLKDATDIQIGTAVQLSKMKTNPTYAALVKAEFDNITFENELKNSSIVSNNGTFNYANADELLNIATAAGLGVYGHTLAWHNQQAAGYYKSYAGITAAAAAELLLNGGFESGGASNFTNWSTFNAANGATLLPGSGGNEVRTGTRSLKVVNPVPHPGQQFQVQLASDLFNTEIGKQYIVSYWVKAASAGGTIRLSTGPTAQYQGDQNIPTTFSQISWTITANSTQTRILFDMGLAANTYYIDDASVKEVVIAPSGGQVAAKLDTALGNYITTIVTRYKGKIKAWDVVNEMFADNGEIRNNSNTANTASDVLVWSNYLGRDFGLKAFNYAKAADPDALLFINDYNLESQPAKLDSLIKYVNEIKAKGAKVDGIGTQMHISYDSYAGIDAMFQKLAATGLKVKISELDVRVNVNGFFSATRMVTPDYYNFQAKMYQYVVQSYYKNVPAAQRYGITVWGVSDADSWKGVPQGVYDFPLLWDADYKKKAAYDGFLKGLKGQ